MGMAIGFLRTAAIVYCYHKDKLNKLLSTMRRHPELCASFTLMVFAFLSIQSKSKSSNTVYRNQSTPLRFFSRSSPVIDFPKGNLDGVANLLFYEEIIAVMYYAPWCSKSMWAKNEYEKAATYLQDEVSFVAINCWYEGGSCKKSNNFLGFPVVYVYHTTLDGFRYTGLLYGEYIVNFVQQIRTPFVYLYNVTGLKSFLSRQDNSVVGFFDFHSSPQPPGFLQFYYAAMRTTVRDPSNRVGFCVITTLQLAESLEMTRPNTVFLLRTLNETLRYPFQRINSSELVTWIHLHRTQESVRWLEPRGSKSLALSRELGKGAAVILFTPRAPLTDTNQAEHILREVSLTYAACRTSGGPSPLTAAVLSSVLRRWHSLHRTLAWLQRCRHVAPPPTPPPPPPPPLCCQSVCVGSATRFNSCDVCRVVIADGLSCSRPRLPATFTFDPGAAACQRVGATYDPASVTSLCCDGGAADGATAPRRTTPGGATSDSYVRTAGATAERRHCQRMRLERLYRWWHDVDELSFHGDALPAAIHGEACRAAANRTLRFYAMDSRSGGGHALLRRLGVNVEPRRTIALIVDTQRESQHLQLEQFSKDALVDLVHNFTLASVTRHRRSAVAPSPPCSASDRQVCVVEVTAATFSSIVMDDDKDVVLLYYAPWCGFCTRFSHVYLSLAQYFRTTKGIVFARINGDANDLGWQFTMPTYPTITLYPANRKADSVSYPSEQPLRLSSLVQFVLRHASPTRRLRLGGAMCGSAACLDANRRAVAALIRRLRQRHLAADAGTEASQKLASARQLHAALVAARAGSWRHLAAIMDAAAAERATL